MTAPTRLTDSSSDDTPADLTAIRATHANCEPGDPCDVVALLAEVDRLRMYEHDFTASAHAYVSTVVDAERTRIRAAVEGLPATTVTLQPPDAEKWLMWWLVDRAAVLAIVEGTDVRE